MILDNLEINLENDMKLAVIDLYSKSGKNRKRKITANRIEKMIRSGSTRKNAVKKASKQARQDKVRSEFENNA